MAFINTDTWIDFSSLLEMIFTLYFMVAIEFAVVVMAIPFLFEKLIRKIKNELI